MRWSLVLLVAACAATTPTPPVTHVAPSPPDVGAAICPPRPTTLLLPAFEIGQHAVETVDDKVLLNYVPVGVHDTNIPSEGVLRAYPLRDGRLVFRITAGTRLWDPQTQKLHDLGTPEWVPVAGYGWIFKTYPTPDTVAFSDIDPDRTGAARLRTVWIASRDPARNYLSAGIAGVLDGSIVAIAISRDFESQKHPTPRTATLACIAGKGDITTREITLPEDAGWVSTDAIRDHRLLLVRNNFEMHAFSDWSTDALIYDLDRDRTRVIGKVAGGHTTCTNMPHPHLRVAWSDDRTSHRGPNDGDLVFDACTRGGDNSVDPVTESIHDLSKLAPQ